MWEDQFACWLENKMEKRTGMTLKNECSIGVDASTSGSVLEIHACHTGLEIKKMLEIKKGLEVVGKKCTAWQKKSRRGERRCRTTSKKS